MADENVVLGSFGAGEMVEALTDEAGKPKTWHIMPPNQQTKAAFVAWLKFRARKELIDQRPLLPADEYKAEQLRLDAAFIAGDYRYGGPVFIDVVATDEGSTTLLQFLLRQRHADITREQVEEIMKEKPEETVWAYRCACHAADPLLFSRPTREAPAGEKTTETAKKPEPPPLQTIRTGHPPAA